MLYKVKVQNACKCFLKTGFPEVSEFDTKEKAKEEAEYIFKVMNTTFCHKHQFKLNEIAGDFVISIT